MASSSAIRRSSICCGAPASARGPTSSTCYRSDVVHRRGRRARRLRAHSRRCRQQDRASRATSAHDARGRVLAATRTSRDARQRWLFRMVHTQPAAPGEDDALLAQPLRDRLHEDRRASWAPPKATRYMAAKPSEDPGRRARPDRDAARQRARQLPRHPASTSRRTRRCCSGSTATRTRARGRRRTSAARSWSCSRWASATTPRPTCTPRRACSPAGTCARPGAAADGSQHYRVRLQRRTSTTPPRRPSAFRSTRDGSKTIPARAGGRRHAGRPRSHRRAGGAIPRPARYLGEEAVPVLRLRDRRRAASRFVEQRRGRVSAERLRHEGRDARGAAVAGVLGSRQLLRALRLAGRVRRPRDQGHRLDRLLARTTR